MANRANSGAVSWQKYNVNGLGPMKQQIAYAQVEIQKLLRIVKDHLDFPQPGEEFINEILKTYLGVSLLEDEDHKARMTAMFDRTFDGKTHNLLDRVLLILLKLLYSSLEKSGSFRTHPIAIRKEQKLMPKNFATWILSSILMEPQTFLTILMILMILMIRAV